MMMGVGDDGEASVRHPRGDLLAIVTRHRARAGPYVQCGTFYSWQQWPSVDRLAQHRAPIHLVSPFAIAVLAKRIKRNMAHYFRRRDGIIGHRAKGGDCGLQ